jgi:hypothetical protein
MAQRSPGGHPRRTPRKPGWLSAVWPFAMAALVLLTGGTLSARLLASTGSGHRPPAAPSPATGSPAAGSPAAGAEGGASAGQLTGNAAAATPNHPPMSSAPAHFRPSSSSCPNLLKFSLGKRTWPNCGDTGVPAGTKLKRMTSPHPTGDGTGTVTEIRKSGTVINGVLLTGSIDVWANNVTIENSVIRAESWWGINLRSGFHGLKVLHCTIVGLPGRGPNNGAEDYGVASDGFKVEVAWSNISEFGDAISMGNGYIHDNYVHDLQTFISHGSNYYNHDDDVISNGGSGLVVTHNTLLNQVSIKRGASASVGLFPEGAINNTTVTDNFIAGGSYALYGGGQTSKNAIITNNVFSTMYWPGSGYYGTNAYWHRDPSNKWVNNRWADGPKAGRPVRPLSG